MPPLRRLILWDIDGTLLHGGPLAREVFDAAVGGAVGRDPRGHRVPMSGRTDPQIALDIMARAGVSAEEARRLLPEVLDRLARGLEEGIDRIRREGHVHPGVRELLERLHADPGVVQSVLTGNLRRGARAKVRAFGLDRFLDLDVGSYGSDHHDRDRLVAVSLAKVERRHRWRPGGRDVWVIGDTPRDLASARAGGARCLLVATGRIPLSQLEGLGADCVLADLSDSGRVADLLLA